MKPNEAFGLSSIKTFDEASTFLAGIECEIESVVPGQVFAGFTATADGSLRNSGIEYISRPYTTGVLLSHFEKMQKNLVFINREEAFSPRTSTHVHINCRSMTVEQIRTLMLLYAVFEEYFFLMVDPCRRNNIHCVPLTETHLPAHYRRDVRNLMERWHKYTALNLLPLQKQGTVEFRHLQGTGDAKVLKEWLLTLENLWRVSQEIEVTKELLQDKKTLFGVWQQIFCDSPKATLNSVLFDSLIKNSLLDVKLAFI